MAKMKLTLPGGEIPIDGKQVSFKAPCDCAAVDCIQIDGVDYDVVDSMGNTVPFGRGVWCNGAVLSVVLDVTNQKAYLQNQNSYTKLETMTEETLSLFGLDAKTNSPNDAFRLLSQFIPSPYGLLVVEMTDFNGNHTSGNVSVSPSIDGMSTFPVGENGFYSIYAPAGTYTLGSVNGGTFQAISPTSTTVEVKTGRVTMTKFSISKTEHGEMDITTSGEFTVPTWMTSIDLFVVGGGGGGGAGLGTGGAGNLYNTGGGGGGYTKTLLGQALAGKTLTIQIGAGGSAAKTAGKMETWVQGGTGGTTSITVDGSVLLSAGGGSGGYEYGGSGGSGGGRGTSNAASSAGYSDGNGIDGYSGGAGQGTTTRKFGEAGNTLYSGGGGGAYGYSNVYSGAGGAGGGGNGLAVKKTATASTTHQGGNATFYGGGGGACLIHKRGSNIDITGCTAISGKGYQGLVSIRW